MMLTEDLKASEQSEAGICNRVTLLLQVQAGSNHLAFCVHQAEGFVRMLNKTDKEPLKALLRHIPYDHSV